jgi:hypothetical protein
MAEHGRILQQPAPACLGAAARAGTAVVRGAQFRLMLNQTLARLLFRFGTVAHEGAARRVGGGAPPSPRFCEGKRAANRG